MDRLKYIIVSFVVINILSACRIVNSECRDMMGCYVSFSDGKIGNDPPCNIHLKMTEDFNMFSFSNNVELQATFILKQSLNFPNLTLTYQISVDGNWYCENNILTVGVDTTTFSCNYVGSTAQTPTEESMARQIRKNIIAGELMPRIREEVITLTQRHVRIIARDAQKIVVEHPETKQTIDMIKLD